MYICCGLDCFQDPKVHTIYMQCIVSSAGLRRKSFTCFFTTNYIYIVERRHDEIRRIQIHPAERFIQPKMDMLHFEIFYLYFYVHYCNNEDRWSYLRFSYLYKTQINCINVLCENAQLLFLKICGNIYLIEFSIQYYWSNIS